MSTAGKYQAGPSERIGKSSNTAPVHSQNFVKRTNSHIGRCIHMAQVEQYRIQAAEWERLAAEVKSPAGQECYRSLAQEWWQLAAGIERLNREGIQEETNMATATAERTGKRRVESDRVEGTTVYDPQGNNIGSIKRIMIDKISGQVAYAVMSFGGFLGMGTDEHAIPWNKLTYDTSLEGFRTDITEQQLRGAPAFSRDRDYDWTDRTRESELHHHYGARPYWEP
jgi:hypothetical protein